MNPVKRITDRMVTHDDLIITNPGLYVPAAHEQAAPHGRLFEVLGMQGNRRVVREVACNTVVVGGAITALENLTGAKAGWHPQTINEIHSVQAEGKANTAPTLCLFGIGTGGAEMTFGTVKETSIKQKDILNPIPMRFSEDATPTGTDAEKYFMKAKATESSYEDYNAWFLKQFVKTPVIKTCWKDNADEDGDGTEVINSEDVSSSSDHQEDSLETFTEIEIALNTLDGREYFEATDQLTTARYNTIGFYTGVPTADAGEYADVRLYSVINFNNRDLSIRSSSSFIYRVYSLI